MTSRRVSTWLAPDVVAHQQCWRDRSGQDQAARLARALGYHSAYCGGTFLAEDWATGSALLVRWPIAHHEHREAGRKPFTCAPLVAKIQRLLRRAA